jgi:hypothetical protein
MSNTIPKISILALAVVLAGCGKKDIAYGQGSPLGEPQSKAAMQTIAKDASGNNVYQDKDGNIRVSRIPVMPFERYTVINVDSDFRAHGDAEIAKVASLYRAAFWAGAKPNHDLLAKDTIPSAQAEKDAFKLADIVKQNKDALDTAYAQAKKHQYYALYTGRNGGVTLGRYDSARKGFPISFSVDEKSAVVWSESHKGTSESTYWELTQVGARSEPEQFYVPASEEEARRIESLLASRRDSYGSAWLPVYYLTHAIGASNEPNYGDRRTAILMSDGVIALEPASKAPLFTIDMRTVAPTPVVYDDKLKNALAGAKSS